MTQSLNSNSNNSGPAWKRWLEDPEIARWHGKLALSSELTADERLRVLARYCDLVGTTPQDLVAKAKDQDGGRRAVENRLQDFVITMRKKGNSPGYVENFTKAVRSWLDHNDILLHRIVIGDSRATPTVENEHVPTPDELRTALTAAGPRGKVIIAFVAFTGVRPEVLGTERATDGLQLRDLPDVVVKDGRVRFRRGPPIQVHVRKELSKVRRKYDTFLVAEGCGYLKAYLDMRAAHGEDLGPSSPIVRPDYGFDRKGRPEDMRGSPFLGRQGICQEIRETLRAQGLRVRPYVLRSYAASALLEAQRQGKLTDIDREFFLGRKGAITSVYTVHKELPQEKVDVLRQVYAGCEPFFGAAPQDTADVRLEVARELVDVFLQAADRLGAGAREKGKEILLSDLTAAFAAAVKGTQAP